MKTISSNSLSDAQVQRRKFLLQCGRFGVVTPPMIALLLSAGPATYAVARSGGGGPGNDPGNDPGGDPPTEGDPPGNGDGPGGGGGGGGGGAFQNSSGQLNAYQQQMVDFDCHPGHGLNSPACELNGIKSSIGNSTRIGPVGKPLNR